MGENLPLCICTQLPKNLMKMYQKTNTDYDIKVGTFLVVNSCQGDKIIRIHPLIPTTTQ